MSRGVLASKILGLLLLFAAVTCFGLSRQSLVPGQPVYQYQDGATTLGAAGETRLTAFDRAGYVVMGVMFSVGALSCLTGSHVHRAMRRLTRRR